MGYGFLHELMSVRCSLISYGEVFVCSRVVMICLSLESLSDLAYEVLQVAHSHLSRRIAFRLIHCCIQNGSDYPWHPLLLRA